MVRTINVIGGFVSTSFTHFGSLLTQISRHLRHWTYGAIGAEREKRSQGLVGYIHVIFNPYRSTLFTQFATVTEPSVRIRMKQT